ncbi:hypothetical protein C8J56DRAFT_955949 [Mycena floridula]|nr:hypothetical protein C8J56DRAFT_955949 [Mycena floridula]
MYTVALTVVDVLQREMSSSYWSNNSPSSCPLTLQSAIQLPESLQSSSPPAPRACSPVRRNSRSCRRATSIRQQQRHCSLADCPIKSPSHPFDQLSWISMMDTSPEDIDLSDIADLSLLPVERAGEGPGPIRRRRTSLRSENLLLEARARSHAISPCTPSPRPRRYSPVRFRNLMPCDSL